MENSFSHNAILTNLFYQFDKEDISYCLLREFDSSEIRNSDIDILLSEDSWHNGISMFLQVVNRFGYQVFQIVDFHYLLGFTIFINERCLHFDFLKNIDYMGVTYIHGCEIIKHRYQKSYLYVSSLTHASLTGWLQNMLYGRTQKKIYNDLITQALIDEKSLFTDQIYDIFSIELGNKLLKSFSAGDFDAAFGLRQRIIVQSAKKHFFRGPIRTIRNFILTIIKHIMFRIKPDGLVIVLIGPDGAGKTTAISEIEPLLCAAKHVPKTYKFHLKPGLLPQLKNLFSPKKWGESLREPNVVSNPHGRSPSGFFISFIRLLYYLVDYTMGYYVFVYPKKAKHQIVIFDRYYYDFVVDPRRMRINLPHQILEFFVKFIPKPSIIIYLDANIRTIVTRKKELAYSEIKRQIKAYHDLIEKFPYAFRVDSTPCATDVGREIVQLILANAEVNNRPI